MSRSSIAVGWTGASGALYGVRLVELLLRSGTHVELMISKAAQMVLATELDIAMPAHAESVRALLLARYQLTTASLTVYTQEQWTAPIASGSSAPRAMVICPCSSGTLAAIAHGTSNTLMERAADVALKERRKLILVHRETPLSLIHLENMLKVTHAGAIVLPANPGFYHQPQTVLQVIDFVVARVLDHLDIEHSLIPRWGGSQK